MASPKIGDIVFAEGCWFLVREKDGQRMKGSLVAPGKEDTSYRFTSRTVERVFREMGKRKARS